jgi:hypothetical protein
MYALRSNPHAPHSANELYRISVIAQLDNMVHHLRYNKPAATSQSLHEKKRVST